MLVAFAKRPMLAEPESNKFSLINLIAIINDREKVMMHGNKKRFQNLYLDFVE